MNKPPFNPYDHFGFLTNRVGRLISNMVSPKLKKQSCDSPSSCLGILAELWVQDGMTQKELGYSIIKNKSSVNKMLKSMVDDGLIIKKTDEQDKRNKRIYLTSKGRKLKEKISTFGFEMESLLLEGHSEEEILIAKKVLTTLYQKLLEHLQ